MPGSERTPKNTTEGTRNELLASLRRLTDEELVARIKGLAARERRATALLVAHLAELDARDVHLREGYSSLLTYCRDVLALSEHEAYNRMEAAHTARRFPAILDLLASGEINLTTVRLLGPHPTVENHASVLESARRRRKAEIEEIVARLSPRADVPASVRRFPSSRAASSARDGAGAAVGLATEGELASSVGTTGPSAAARGVSGATGPAGPGGTAPAPSGATAPAVTDGSTPSVLGVAVAGAPALAANSPAGTAGGTFLVTASGVTGVSPVPPRRPAEVTPLSPDRYRYQLTIGGTTLEKLRLAKDMLRHTLPTGDDEAILDRALTALLENLARSKFGACQKADGSGDTAPADGREAAAESRHVPVAVKRAVWVRDLGRCAFVAPDGRRCGERAFVEFHHVKPYAVGGRATIDGIELRCGRHNRYEARVFFAREPVSEAMSPRSKAVARALHDQRRVARSFRNESGEQGRVLVTAAGPGEH